MADHTFKRTFREHDKLGREKFADFLIEVMKVSESEEGSYTLAIDAPYGSGKTWFLQMLENKINEEYAKTTQEVPLVAVRYDAWKYDYFDEPLEPLVEQIMHSPVMVDEEAFNAAKGALKKAVAGVKALAKVDWTEVAADMPGWLKMVPAAVSSIEAGTEAGSGLLEEARKLKRYQSALDNLQDVLRRAAVTYGENAKLVVIIDELDRCRPDFAIRTLEVTKHLLASENVVFLYAVDMKQLGRAVETMYGAGMDAEGYLLRLFNHIAMLPTVDKGHYLATSLSDILNEDYLFPIVEEIQHQRKFLKLTYRDIDRIVSSYRLLVQMQLYNYVQPEAYLLYFYLLTLKYVKRSAFDYLVSRDSDSDAEEYLSRSDAVKNQRLRQAIAALIAQSTITRDIYHDGILLQVLDETRDGAYRRWSITTTQRFSDAYEYRLYGKSGEQKAYLEKSAQDSSIEGIIFYADLVTLFARGRPSLTIGEYVHQQLEMYNYEPKS